MYYIISSLNPVFNELCKEKANKIATEILNVESSKVLKNVKYNEFVTIIRDSNNKIKMLQVNTIKINMLASELAYNIQQELNKKENTKIALPIGSITGSKFLLGLGPKINIQIIPSGSIATNLKSEFQSVGINQTLHRIYMEIICRVSIVTPYDREETEIVNQILMTENVIVGEIPETYYNLDGISENNVLDVMQ